MADFLDIGNKLFVTMIAINFLLIGFGGYQVQPFLEVYVPDQNVTSESITGSQLNLQADPTVEPTGTDTIFDFVVETVGIHVPNVINLLKGMLFGFVDVAEFLHFPNEIMLAMVYPIAIFMFFYTIIFLANLGNLIFRGGGGGNI